MSGGIGGNSVSSSRVHWALEKNGLRGDDTQHIFLGNNIFIFRKEMPDRIVLPRPGEKKLANEIN